MFGHHHAHHDDHAHAHGHSHGHAHHANPDDHSKAFLIAIILNSVFIAAEFIYGIIANSTALMADAGHNLSDVLGLGLAWGAAILARKPPSGRYTFGLRSSSILAALANAMLLLVACGAIATEAVQRFFHPPAVAGETVMLVAGIGIVINGLSAWLFMKGSKGDLNIRGAFLHMAADTVVSLGVVVVGGLILWTDLYWIDPVTSLVIVAVIVAGTWGLLRESTQLALSAVPKHVDADAIAEWLRSRPGVSEIHDLHIWGMSTTESALTVHLVMPEGYPDDTFLDEVSETLRTHYAIQHSTLQVEQGTTNHTCTLEANNGTHHT